MTLAQFVDRDVHADVDAELDVDALRAQLVDAALDDVLLDLEVRHAEADQAAGEPRRARRA